MCSATTSIVPNMCSISGKSHRLLRSNFAAAGSDRPDGDRSAHAQQQLGDELVEALVAVALGAQCVEVELLAANRVETTGRDRRLVQAVGARRPQGFLYLGIAGEATGLVGQDEI